MAEINVTSDNFEREVIQREGPVLVSFYSECCDRCSMLFSILSEIDEEYGKSVRFCKVSREEDPELFHVFGVTVVPTILVFSKGVKTKTITELQTKESLLSLLGF